MIYALKNHAGTIVGYYIGTMHETKMFVLNHEHGHVVDEIVELTTGGIDPYP